MIESTKFENNLLCCDFLGFQHSMLLIRRDWMYRTSDARLTTKQVFSVGK
jgi:hypothetical protein